MYLPTGMGEPRLTSEDAMKVIFAKFLKIYEYGCVPSDSRSRSDLLGRCFLKYFVNAYFVIVRFFSLFYHARKFKTH